MKVLDEVETIETVERSASQDSGTNPRPRRRRSVRQRGASSNGTDAIDGLQATQSTSGSRVGPEEQNEEAPEVSTSRFKVGDRVRITKAPRNIGKLATIRETRATHDCYGEDLLILPDGDTFVMAIMAKGVELVAQAPSNPPSEPDPIAEIESSLEALTNPVPAGNGKDTSRIQLPIVPIKPIEPALALKDDHLLTRLALEINQAHADCEEAESTALNASRSAIQSALIAGEKLALAKEQVPHGEWLPWLEENCPKLSERNAQRYMRIWRKRDELPKSDTRDGFSLRQALEVLATPKEDVPEESPRPGKGDRPPSPDFTVTEAECREWAAIEEEAGCDIAAGFPRAEEGRGAIVAIPETQDASTRKERLEGDKYYSPDGLIQALLDQIEIAGEVLDPSAGDGRMAEIITEETPAWVYTADLDPGSGIDYNRRFDATARSNWEAIVNDLFDEGISWTITNPPFNQAHLILPLAWENSRIGVAFLLRLSWLEPCGNRADWMKEHADHLTNVIVFNPRPQFRDEPGGDQVTVAWFVWRKDFSWQKLGLPCPFTFITDWRTTP